MGTNCAPLLADIFLYSYEAEFTSLCSRLERNSYHLDSTSHIDASMTYYQSIILIFRIILVRLIPLSLREKTRLRAVRLLPTWIFSCRSGGTVSCSLPFMTNETISISQTLLSWVTIFYLHQTFLSQPIWYARACFPCECFILRATRLSWKLFGQEYVRERLKSSLRKFYCRYGDLIKHYEVPLSQMLHVILGHDHIKWHPPLIRHFTKSWPFYPTRLYYRFWCNFLIPGGFNRTFATGAASQQRTLTPWSCPIWDLHLF